jgi:hypothetical protein
MLSVIFPSEPSDPKILQSLSALTRSENIEVIVVGISEAHSRAERLNMGFHRSKGQVILFHHPRSTIENAGIEYLANKSLTPRAEPFWGGFTHRFDASHPVLQFTSWYSNHVRPKRGILYLDHGIFFDRRLWRDLPHVDIFEDTLLCHEFRKSRRPEVLPFFSITSAIRFQKNGIWKQSTMNQMLKIGFYFGISHKTMNRLYEHELELNSKYSK